jgi:hypothetical protein
MRHFLVRVAARDVAQDLALARGKQVEIRIGGVGCLARERIQDEPGQARGEDRVALMYSPNGGHELRR